MDKLEKYEVWFVTGSQDLYGPETLKQVAVDSAEIASYLDKVIKDFAQGCFQTCSHNP